MQCFRPPFRRFWVCFRGASGKKPSASTRFRGASGVLPGCFWVAGVPLNTVFERIPIAGVPLFTMFRRFQGVLGAQNSL